MDSIADLFRVDDLESVRAYATALVDNKALLSKLKVHKQSIARRRSFMVDNYDTQHSRSKCM